MKKRISWLVLLGASLVCAEIRPGAVYREFTYRQGFLEQDPGVAEKWIPKDTPRQAPRYLDLDMRGAIAAEAAVEFTQHIGTSEERFRANGNAWIPLPLPAGTPGDARCYYRESFGRPAIAIPLEQLRQGRNEFRFAAGPQVCHGFQWGLLSVYSFTIRIYYAPERAPGKARVAQPVSGARVGVRQELRAEVRGPVRRVDFLGEFADVNAEGEGVELGWRYLLRDGALAGNLGSASDAPYRAVWDTSWVPDQERPMRIMARVEDESGLFYTTEAVEGLEFQRPFQVRLFQATDVPERFGVRLGARMTCPIPVDGDLSRAAAARLWVPTHFALHKDEKSSEISLNGVKIASGFGSEVGSFDAFDVPVKLLRRVNEFTIRSDTEHHAAEVNWPGPALLVRYVAR